MAPDHWVETEGNGGSKSTKERGPSLVGSLGLSVNTRDFWSVSAALFGPVRNIFSWLYAILIPLSPSPSKLDTGQAAVLGRLFLSTCLWFLPSSLLDSHPN